MIIVIRNFTEPTSIATTKVTCAFSYFPPGNSFSAPCYSLPEKVGGQTQKMTRIPSELLLSSIKYTEHGVIYTVYINSCGGL